jgi:hypothetical protein
MNLINLINFQKIIEGINFKINHGSLIMLVNSVVNSDLAIAKERLYQDYIQECQILLIERPELAKKLAIDLILREQAWFPSHLDTREIGISQLYDKCFQENISNVKNYLLRLNLV